ncbi:HNH endonuclease [bacterium]|jgi:hypothetical protein|nr:HNH endonuclease [bacterium]|tara:strand:- start:1422 stop:1823 length:402 start_codon:yes stop_codon:yes gene_type:complete
MATTKTRNNGRWTEARHKSFIISALRGAHSKWGVKADVKKSARVSTGKYLCACCGTVGPATLPPDKGQSRRKNNAAVDHIDPVVCPKDGFIDWNTYINRMFLEEDGYQVLCWACHGVKTRDERELRTLNRKKK